MPGRLCIHDDISFKQDIFKTFGNFTDDVQVLYKRYNIAPTINIPIFTNTKLYTYAHFGLIPSWANDRSSLNINARSETVFEKKSFRESYKQRRCIIPINGYYEWKKDTIEKTSTPYIITSKTHEYLAFAAIYDYWYDNKLGKNILSCALLTTEPNTKIETIHDRMPVILKQDDWQVWLNTNSTYEKLNQLFTPCENETIEITEVGDLVNSVKNDTKECMVKSTKIKTVQTTLF
ncbi:MAG: SOS response-associated peptidase [Arcobacteraceae bacterium]